MTDDHHDADGDRDRDADGDRPDRGDEAGDRPGDAPRSDAGDDAAAADGDPTATDAGDGPASAGSGAETAVGASPTPDGGLPDDGVGSGPGPTPGRGPDGDPPPAPDSGSGAGDAASAPRDRPATIPGPGAFAREYVPVFLKGAFMGTADTVPGISGGTIAFVTGIYERLIAAITAVGPGDVRHLRHAATVHRPDSRAELAGFARRIDLPFLLALGAGLGTAVLTVASVVEVAAERYPAALSALFFGLIAASAVVLYDDAEVNSPRRVAVAVAGAAGAFLVGGVPGATAPHTLPVVAVAGAVAVCATVLPGVSGAFLLLLVGQYEFVLGTVTAVTDGLLAVAAGGDPRVLVGPVTTLAAFGTGAAVGLVTMAHAVRWALDNYRGATLTLLVSLMVGGLRVPAESVREAWPGTAGGVALVALAAVLGAVAVLAFDRYTDDLDY